MVTKRQIQRWARDEWARLEEEKTRSAQAVCTHIRSGRLITNTAIVVCDDCKKELRAEDQGSYLSSPSKVEQQAIDLARVR